jgi:hypothetical protein
VFLLPFWRLLWRWDIIVERWSNVWVASNAVVHDLTYFSIFGLASAKFDQQDAGRGGNWSGTAALFALLTNENKSKEHQ